MKTGMMRPWLVLLCILVSAPSWADCPLDLGHGTGIVIFSDLYMLALRPDPLRIEVGQPFALLMNVCTKGGEPAELVRVEATMTEREHGMDHAPTVTPNGDGRYRVEGLLFDLPGSWEVAFDVRSGGEVQRLTHGFVLK
jgi:hypothetical protein